MFVNLSQLMCKSYRRVSNKHSNIYLTGWKKQYTRTTNKRKTKTTYQTLFDKGAITTTNARVYAQPSPCHLGAWIM